MRFQEAYAGWQAGRLRQEEAALLLGVCERTFRRYIDRYEEAGIEGLIDHRLNQVSHRRAPVDEVMALTRARIGRAMRAGVPSTTTTWYRRAGGKRSYTWVKRQLQKGRVGDEGAHGAERIASGATAPRYRECCCTRTGADHEWVPGQRWDLIVTMDDATNEHYAMEFVEEEGTHSSFSGVGAVISAHGLFSALYTDRGSHYWFTPEAGGKIDRRSPTQFGRAMQQLGIETEALSKMSPALLAKSRPPVRSGL